MTFLRTVTEAELSAPLVPFEEACRRLRELLRPLAVAETPVVDALGLVLDTDLRAAIDTPGFDNSAMDGYAVNSASTAGARQDNPIALDTSLTIATGRPLPAGCDAVVPWESTEQEGEAVLVRRPFRAGENVRRRGAEARAGDIIVRSGTSMGPLQVGIASALGYPAVNVHRRPRVAIASSGNEIAAPGSPITGAQVHDSNRFFVGASVETVGAEVVSSTLLRDDPDAIEAWLLDAVTRSDVVVTSGGASVGQRDWIRSVVERHAEIVFWHVGVKPGKPIAFARLGETLLFVLPGNPGATFACTHAFVLPAIRALKGENCDAGTTSGALTADVSGDARRTLLCPAQIDHDSVVPLPSGSSQLLGPYLDATALAIIPPGGARVGDRVVALEIGS